MKPMLQRQEAAAPNVRLMGWALATVIAVWILSMTLTPGRSTDKLNLIPFSQKTSAIACVVTNCFWRRRALLFLIIDGLGNAAVFVPLGIALAVARWPAVLQTVGGRPRLRPAFGWPLRAALLGGLFSLCIELAQIFVPGRTTDVDDLILNTTGALCGAALVWLLYPLLRGHHD